MRKSVFRGSSHPRLANSHRSLPVGSRDLRQFFSSNDDYQAGACLDFLLGPDLRCKIVVSIQCWALCIEWTQRKKGKIGETMETTVPFREFRHDSGVVEMETPPKRSFLQSDNLRNNSTAWRRSRASFAPFSGAFNELLCVLQENSYLIQDVQKIFCEIYLFQSYKSIVRIKYRLTWAPVNCYLFGQIIALIFIHTKAINYFFLIFRKNI